jgi:hypothetical protein
MWKQVLATAASASVLVAGIAGPGAGAAGPGDAAARAGADTVAGGADERTGVAAPVRSIQTATGMIEEREVALAQAATARQAAEEAAEAARSAAEEAARVAAAEEAARVAAAQAAAEQAAAEQAAAAQAAAKAAQRTAKVAAPPRITPPPRPPAPPKPPPGPTIAWSTTVVDTGGQEAVNRCLGGLTHWFEDVDGKPYYPIHRACGGMPVLALRLGDRVRIDGTVWIVTDRRDVPKGSRYDAAAGLNGQILVQTCLRDDATMRIVALTAA